MGKTVVLAEKPSVGRDIARVLKCDKKINGALEGVNYIVTWGLGHLVTLCDPERYDDKYKTWKMETLPMMPEHMKLEVIKQTGKQYQAVKTQLMRNDVTEVVIATDAGREGELVARWILAKSGCKKPLKRLWISSVTDKAIREGFAHLKPGKDYENLYHAAAARSEADWLVGMNATRALTCKYNAQLSCGRVQTPTLAMIAQREEEIRNFKPQVFYGMRVHIEGLQFTWQDKKSGSARSFDKERITKLMAECKGRQLKITEVNKTVKRTPAPQLYDLTELQRDANKKWDYSAKETLNIMQRLYENHKVLTYPRTDSRYLTTDVVGTIRERLDACGTGPYRKLAAAAKTNPLTGKLAFVDNAKVSDHHAIIPTEQFVQLEHMTIDERRIYDLVVRRFLAVLFPPYEYEHTAVRAELSGEIFTAQGNSVKSQGWKAAYETMMDAADASDSGDGELRKLPEFKNGDVLSVHKLEQTEGKTSAPPLFNEATLLSAMENPAKYMESNNKEDARILGETGGLGTVATRADIIEKLFKSFLVEKKGKDMMVTAKGRQLLELVPADLRKPELTASWERRLNDIAEGRQKSSVFTGEIRQYTVTLVDEIKQGAGTFRHENMTKHKCPECGKFMLLVKGKNSMMEVCQDRECGYKVTLSRTTNARCPKCHKKMEMAGRGDAQTFVCKCGYKEKLSAFEERKKKQGGGVSKRDVQQYMKKNQKEEPINTAFADMLKNIKLD